MRHEVRALTEVTTAEPNDPWTIEERVDLLRSQQRALQDVLARVNIVEDSPEERRALCERSTAGLEAAVAHLESLADQALKDHLFNGDISAFGYPPYG
jgi:hypothetical protein